MRKESMGALRNPGRETSLTSKHLNGLGTPVRGHLDKSTEVGRPAHCEQHHPPGMGSFTHYKGKVSPVTLCFFTEDATCLAASSSNLIDLYVLQTVRKANE